MKRERKAKPVCYLCGGIPTTRDHVPPLGMFPAPRPKNLVTVPTCESCYRGGSLHDEYFRVTVATGSRESTQSIALLHQRILPRMRVRDVLRGLARRSAWRNKSDQHQRVDGYSSFPCSYLHAPAPSHRFASVLVPMRRSPRNQKRYVRRPTYPPNAFFALYSVITAQP